MWNDLTVGWPEDNKVQQIPFYYKIIVGSTIKVLDFFKAIGRQSN